LLGSGITVDDVLLSKFKTIDSQILSLERVRDILNLVGANHESKDDTKFSSFISHLEHNHSDITGANHDEK